MNKKQVTKRFSKKAAEIAAKFFYENDIEVILSYSDDSDLFESAKIVAVLAVPSDDAVITLLNAQTYMK